MAQHLKDHVLNYYLVESHNAVDMAQRDKLIQEEAIDQVPLIIKVQRLVENRLADFANQIAAITNEAENYKPQSSMPPDNSMQIAKMNASIQEKALQERSQYNQSRIDMELHKLQKQYEIDFANLEQRNKVAQDKLQIEIYKQIAENNRTRESNEVREKINDADNDTAKIIAEAELNAGDKASFSTGSGINPNP